MLRRGAVPRAAPRRATFLGLSIPTALALLVFLVAPLALTVSMSFHEELTKDVLGPFKPTLEHYQRATSVASYWQLLWTSGLMAFIVAVVGTLLAYPVAYFLAFRAGRRAGLY